MSAPRTLLVLAVGLALAPAGAEAQSLRGSRASVDRVYRQAHDHDLTFFKTSSGVRSAASNGRLVRLRGDANYRLHQVSYPYALPATATFVTRLASQYRAKCGEKMVVTSATRPKSFRLSNSVDKSVHPAGMAVDIRRPTAGRCAAWLRETLLFLEGKGVIDATEERNPPHFHVAVFPAPYLRYAGVSPSSQPRVARAETPASTRTHKVRRGETLWDIARRHGTSVDRLKKENDIRSSRILAGQVLQIPLD
jgi:LysM repeat protein